MTRVTNIGRKRKYLQAGFSATDVQPASEEHPMPEGNSADGGQPGDSLRPKKKRRKTKEPRMNGSDEQRSIPGGEANPARQEFGLSSGRKKTNTRGGAKSVSISGYKKRTEQRRLKRVSDRQVVMVCFGCREKGHAAKDCPKAGREGEDGQNNNATVGMCYRCGSTKHTLSRCKKPEDPTNPLPFASCFICSKKGHLASSCPQNKEKGIYPNGGCCKLCSEKTHLAKDCELREKDASGTSAATIFGTGNGAGADEDDFHTFKRKNAEVSKGEKKDEQRRRQLDVKAGLHTGTIKAFGKTQVSSKPKKVVFF